MFESAHCNYREKLHMAMDWPIWASEALPMSFELEQAHLSYSENLLMALDRPIPDAEKHYL